MVGDSAARAGAPDPDDDNAGGGGPGQPGPVNITSIAMFLVPLVAALGVLATTGTIGRVQRDRPVWFTIAILLVLGAGALWVTRTQLKDEQTRPRFWLLLGTIACAFVGFFLACALAIDLVNDEPRPRIAADLSDDNSSLKANVTASDLPTRHRLAIEIDVLQRSAEDPARILASERVYRAYLGPDGDGNVSHTIEARLPSGDFTDVGIKAFTGTTSYGCDDYPFEEVRSDEQFGSGTGCVTIALEPPR